MCEEATDTYNDVYERATDTVARDYETEYANPYANQYAGRITPVYTPGEPEIQVPVTRIPADSLKPIAKAMKQLNKAMQAFHADVFTVIGIDLAYTEDIDMSFGGDPTALRLDWDMVGEEFVLKML